MKRPTPAEQAAKWQACQVCGQRTPFVFRSWDLEHLCIPCYEANKSRIQAKARKAFTHAAHDVGVLK